MNVKISNKTEAFKPSQMIAVNVIAVIISLFGAAAIVAHHLASMDFVFRLRHFLPLHYDSGVGFLFLGLGFLLIKRLPNVALAFGVIVALIGAVSLTANFFDIDIGIYRLFEGNRSFTFSEHVEHMPINSALCFVFAGAAIIVNNNALRFKLNFIVTGILGSIITALGFVGIVSCFLDPASAHVWKRFYMESIGASGCFWLAGICAIITIIKKGKIEEPVFQNFIASSIGIAIATIVICFWIKFTIHESFKFGEMVKHKGEYIKSEITGPLESQIIALFRMAKRWEIRGSTPRNEWEKDAEFYINHYQTLDEIAWINPSFKTAWKMTPQGATNATENEPAFKADTLRALRLAGKKRGPHILPLIDLDNGDKGMLACIPLFPNGKFDGYIAGVFSFHKIFNLVLSQTEFNQFSIAVFDNGKEVYSCCGMDINSSREFVYNAYFDIFNLNFLLKVWPRAEFANRAQSSMPTIILVVGILIAFLMAMAAHLVIRVAINAKRIAKTHNDLQEAQEELSRKDKLAAIGQIASSISHELRNPLGIIGNSVYFLNLTLGGGDTKVKKHLDILKKEVDVSDRIIGDLLDFSRESVPVMKDSDINAVVNESVKRLKIPVNFDLKFNAEAGLPKTRFDVDQILIVVTNILANAVASMKNGGGLIISTFMDDQYICVKIKDHGCGIPESEIKKIFTPLFTTKSKGIGLGMSIVKGIIDKHRGEIEVESAPGIGSTFTVKLPKSC